MLLKTKESLAAATLTRFAKNRNFCHKSFDVLARNCVFISGNVKQRKRKNDIAVTNIKTNYDDIMSYGIKLIIRFLWKPLIPRKKLSLCSMYSVWTFRDFSRTLMLREINFRHKCTICHFHTFGGFIFWFLWIFAFFEGWKWPN